MKHNSTGAAGFSGVEWVPPQVSEAGIREFGEDFWAGLLANPPLEMLRCRAWPGELQGAGGAPRSVGLRGSVWPCE
ncbi:hypothetical protein ACFWBX_10190 [Streptomyces sp. NPDC059991]|uniref:hypothetical protein n=1 Tax=Streptomyces sp. NPDC059991 TaxID=3347028 RepID=UPI00368B1404